LEKARPGRRWRRAVAELGVYDDVDLPRFRDNAPAYMARSALFVLSSAWEGLPTVLIGRCRLAPRSSPRIVQGPREILQEERVGALVPIGNAPALASAMELALDCGSPPLPTGALTAFTLDAAVDHYLRLIGSA
jgi:glycosyltransferase involved in cell wall biosynthesis